MIKPGSSNRLSHEILHALELRICQNSILTACRGHQLESQALSLDDVKVRHGSCPVGPRGGQAAYPEQSWTAGGLP